MLSVRTAVVVAATVVTGSLGFAAPAGADPGTGECPLSVTFLCRFLPVAPDLDHDIDLTRGDGTLNGERLPQMPEGVLNTEDGPPVSPCLNGCN